MKSIRHRLVLYTLILITLPLIITTVTNNVYTRQNYEKELEKNNKLLASSIADQVTAFIEEGYSLTEQIALNNDIRDFVPNDQKNVLMNVYDKHPYFGLLYVQGVDGMQTARTTGELGNRSNRWWFIKAMEEQTSFVSKSYYTLGTNAPVTTIAMPVYGDSNKIIGVMAADIELNELQDRVQKYSDGSKFAFIIDGEGVVIAHPDTVQVSELYNYKTLTKTVLRTDETGAAIVDADGNQMTEEQNIEVPETLMQIAEKALSGESGSETYKDNDGVAVISAYQSITLPGQSDNWAVVTVESREDAMAFINDIRVFSGSIGIISVIIAIVLTIYVSNKIVGPIKQSANYLEIIAEGNFMVEVDEKMLSRKDEIGIIAMGIQTMKDSLKDLAMKITAESMNIQNGVDNVVSEVNELNHNLEGISATTEELSANTEETAASSEEMTATTQEIERAVKTIAKNSGKGALAAKDISEKAEATKERLVFCQLLLWE